MARQNINTGVAANDNTGDALRNAFIKTNENLLELYACAAPIRLRANQWYASNLSGILAAGTAMAVNTVRMVPFIVRETCTISQLGVRITTLGAGSIDLAIYASNPATGLPTGLPLQTAPPIPTNATGPFSASLVAPVQLQPGLYWLASNTNNATAVYQNQGAASPFLAHLLGAPTLAGISASATSSISHLSYAQTYGTWPDVTAATPTLASTTTYASIFALVSSVP